MAGKLEKLSKAELARRLAEMEKVVASHVGVQEVIQDLHVHQEEIRVQNEQLLEMKHSLEQSRDRFADLYDFAPIAYVTLDGNGMITEINLTGSMLLGKERRHIIGSPFMTYVDEKDHAPFLNHMRRCREAANGRGNGAQVTSELQLAARDGRKISGQLLTRAVVDSSGIMGYRTVVSDLTELKRAEEDRRELAIKEQNARAAAEAKDRFMAILSHER